MSDEAVTGTEAGGPLVDAVIADEALLRSVGAVREFMARPGYAFSNAELLANLRSVHSFLATVNAAYLGLVAELDTRPGVLPGVVPGKAAVTFLREGLRIAGPQAGRGVRRQPAAAAQRTTR